MKNYIQHIIYTIVILILIITIAFVIQNQQQKFENLIESKLVEHKGVSYERYEEDIDLIHSAILDIDDRLIHLTEVHDDNVEIFNQNIKENSQTINDIIDYLR